MGKLPGRLRRVGPWAGRGGHGSVADSKASSRRTLGVGLEHKVDVVIFVPRPWTGRPALAAWARQHPAYPLFVEQPGWHGPSRRRRVAVEDSDGQVASEALRGVGVHASQLAQQPTPTSAATPGQAAAAVANHVRQGQARWCACRPDAAAARAAYADQEQGHRGRRTRRARRGRPAKLPPPPREAGYRRVVEVEALAHPEEDNGWTGLATTVDAEGGPDADLPQAYQDHNTPGEPGLRGLNPPAALAPVWLAKPERSAALAMLTVARLAGLQRDPEQGRLSLRTHDQQSPGNTGLTATPTAAVGFALLAPVVLVQL